jgi:tRNA A-37 threonylcarbamoyl transferase component Bud32
MKLSPFKTSYKTTNTLLSLYDENTKYVVKCYMGADNLKRCCREKNAINYWRATGFNAPEIYDITIPEIEVPYLVLSCIEGMSLRGYLSRNTCPINEKLQTLEKLFSQMSKRHSLAVRNNDRCLIHYDPSSGNIICVDQGFCYVDFEAKPRYPSVMEAAGAELLTLCKWIVRDLGIESLDTVMGIVVASYRGQEPLLRLLVKRTSGRQFQFFHRWRDSKRKSSSPRAATKYDIANAIDKLL